MTDDTKAREARAWTIVHEYGPRWWNEYTSKYPNSKACERSKREEMAHYCVMAALAASGPDPEAATPDDGDPATEAVSKWFLADIARLQSARDAEKAENARLWHIAGDAIAHAYLADTRTRLHAKLASLGPDPIAAAVSAERERILASIDDLFEASIPDGELPLSRIKCVRSYTVSELREKINDMRAKP